MSKAFIGDYFLKRISKRGSLIYVYLVSEESDDVLTARLKDNGNQLLRNYKTW